MIRQWKSIPVVLILWALSLPSFAQTVRNLRERRQDKKQIEETQQLLERDQAELQEFQKLVSGFNGAVETQNRETLQALLPEVFAAMKRELEQAKERAEQAKKELQQSSRELRSERRDVRQDRDDVDDNLDNAEAAQVRDALNRGDDRRDRRDDKEDLQAIGSRAQHQGKILTELSASKPFEAEDPAAVLEQFGNLLGEFQQLMVADLQSNHEEIEEDAKELKEDRRETRSDRRARRRRNE